MTITMTTRYGPLHIIDEPLYSFDSQDNPHRYSLEICLANGLPSSIHGIDLNHQRIMVVGAGGGCSTVHRHSALMIDDKLHLAVGDHVVCLSLDRPHRLLWSVRADAATCFGIHWNSHRSALISHGELEISRISTDGDLMWRTSGADIFTGDFRLLPDYIEAVDFNSSAYRLDYRTGKTIF